MLATGLLESFLASSGMDASIAVERVRYVVRLDQWVIVQARFTTQLEPGIFLGVVDSSDHITYKAVWGGPAPQGVVEIRTYFRTQIPDVPAALLECMRPLL